MEKIKQEFKGREKSNLEFIELDLNKNDLDKLSNCLESDNLRDYGYGHIELSDGKLLIIECKELIKNREEYENSLRKLGLKAEEIMSHFKEINKQKSNAKYLDETKELKEKLEKTERLAEERFNQIKYLQADIENLRKRYEKEKHEIIKTADEALIKELLVVLDSFDAAIKITEEGKNKKGLLMLEKKFFDILVGHGLKEIEAIGKKFNPNFHELLCKEFSKKQDNEVIEVIQKGYTVDSKVIRTSKVKISKGLKKQDKIENNNEKD